MRVLSDETSLYDAAVIGAGPAGCAAAAVLAQAGWKVLAVDRGVPGQGKVCGGFLGPEVSVFFETLRWEREFETLPKNEIREIWVTGPSGASFRTPFEGRSGYAVSRSVFDAWLCRKAERSGAVLNLRTRVCGALRKGGLWRLTLSDDQKTRHVAVKHLIRAHGRRTAKPAPGKDVFFACKTVYEGAALDPSTVSLHFAERAHVGFNPLGSGKTAMCFYAHGSYLRAAGGNLDRVMQAFGRQNALLADSLAAARRVEGWSSCQAEPDSIRRFYESGTFFAGDAVTMVNPIIGGGIPVAMSSGHDLARSLLEAARLGRDERWAARRYASGWAGSFERRWRAARVLGAFERSPGLMRILLASLRGAPFLFRVLASAARPIRVPQSLLQPAGH